MDDLRAAVCQFDGIEVVQLGNLLGVGENLGVGVQHAVHIFPHRHRLGVEDVRHHGRRVVRAFAAERRGRPVRCPADKALPDEDVLDALGQCVFQQRLRSLEVDPRILVALFREEAATHVDPAVRHPGIIEVFRNDSRRHQLAERHDRIVPQFGIPGLVDRTDSHALQFVEQGIDLLQLLRAVPQVVDDPGMVLAQCRDILQRKILVALLHPLEHLFERIGRLAHGRNDDEEVLLIVDNLAQVAHPVGIPHRRTSEFIDFHYTLFY